MSGYIYEFSSRREHLNKLSAEKLQPFLWITSATSLTEAGPKEAAEARIDLYDQLDGFDTDPDSPSGMHITEKKKAKYFKNRFLRLQSLMEDMTLERFAYRDPYDLRMIVENPNEDYVSLEGAPPIPMDRFIRTAESEVGYFIGTILKYR